ncbi:hypothetical protein EDB89DRAFT_2169034 [Lactarius sanguifluus]|nr:hypothetical protein EDB89DRAFT_2169034 [Lactarius sanguifluus]
MTFAPRAARSPFDSPPRAAHRVRPRSPLEGCLGIESFGGYFTVFQILPQRYRVPARQALLPPVHIHYHLLVGGFLFRAAVPRLARYNLLFSCVYGLFFGPSSQFPTISGMVLLLYAIRSDCQHCPCAGTSLLFLYAIGSGFAFARAREKYIGFGCAIAHAQENSHVLAIGSVLSLPSFQLRPTPRYRAFHVLAVFSVSIRGSDPAALFDHNRYFRFIRLSARHLRQRHYFLPSAASSSSAAITGVYYTARFTSRRRAWLAHYRELLAQIGRVSQTFTYAVVPGAVFIVPSLGQVDKLPAFPASCHRDGHSVVRNASSWPSVSRWDYMLIKHIHRVSAHRAHLAAADILRLRLCSTSLTLADFPFRRLLPLFRASAATVLSGHVTPCKFDPPVLFTVSGSFCL